MSRLRRLLVPALGAVLVLSAGGCMSESEEQPPPQIREASVEVTDPDLDADAIGPSTRPAPNVDLVLVGARVDGSGIGIDVTYAKPFALKPPARWGLRLELARSQGPKLSVVWNYAAADGPGRSEVELAPRLPGCTAVADVDPGERQVRVGFSPGCLPGAEGSHSRAWVQIESLESQSSWRDGESFNYAWDHLFDARVSDETARLYLP